jgi:hypothetical protein
LVKNSKKNGNNPILTDPKKIDFPVYLRKTRFFEEKKMLKNRIFVKKIELILFDQIQRKLNFHYFQFLNPIFFVFGLECFR